MKTNAQVSLLDEIIVDGFAGGGGWSWGIEQATGTPVEIAINHDPDAILMHKTNHPYTRHYCESIYDVDPRKAVAGRAVGWAHFSPDCKHFSKAKGGKPVDKAIRGLAWVVLRWAGLVRPRIISLENVEEFQTWGPVRRGRPVKSRKGETFKKFVAQLEALGYIVEWRELRACDYGAPTIRKRFFLLARCDGKPIAWPAPTHGDPKGKAAKSGKLQPWRTAAEIIDWSIPCPSIFERKRPLAENTMRRIARGIQKFVIDSPTPFIVQVNHSGEGFRGQNIGEPLQTITAKHGYGIVTPVMTAIGQTGFSNDRSYSPAEPVRTLVSKAEQCLVTPFLAQYHTEKATAEVRGQDMASPIQTVDASNRYAFVALTLIQTGYGEAPGQAPRAPGLQKPLGTVVSTEKHALVSAHVMKMKGTNVGQPANEPLQTITAGGLHFAEVQTFLIKYYGQGTGQAENKPLDTITSHDTFGLVIIHGINYQIVDIGMRMLSPRELYNAQGFPPDYIIDHDYTGMAYPKSKQVARCGNAVPPPFAKALVQANWPERCKGVNITTVQDFNQYAAV
ncbi:MAG: DNA cytosine methyltransferase [Oscillospiraceae bacterium]